jgi:hypothetical protein
MIDEFRTGIDGRFEFRADAAGSLRIVVTAAGFAEVVISVSPDSRTLQVTLQPAPFFEAVNVTSSRADLPRADPSVTVTRPQLVDCIQPTPRDGSAIRR